MSIGVSAHSARESILMAAGFFLGEEEAKDLKLPTTRWFQEQREAAGYESWLYAMIDVAGSDEIIQHGCDESNIGGHGTHSQWVLVRKGKDKHVITFEAGGIIPGGAAEEIAAHISNTWKRGNEAIGLLRDMLGDEADDLVPLRNGGVKLFRIESTMHDGCNTAKAVVPFLKELKNKSGENHFGAELWAKQPEKLTKLLDYLCGNHGRNYPLDEFNRNFESYLEHNLSSAFQRCQEEAGTHARLEKSGEAFLRSICKLAYSGIGAYEKGDGKILFVL